METKDMSAREALTITKDLINGIQIPVALAEQIARPLCQAVANIDAVIAAIKEEPTEVDDDVQRE